VDGVTILVDDVFAIFGEKKRPLFESVAAAFEGDVLGTIGDVMLHKAMLLVLILVLAEAVERVLLAKPYAYACAGDVVDNAFEMLEASSYDPVRTGFELRLSFLYV
jgi:hypothetical protein